MARTTETSAWNPVRSKMEQFTKVINGLNVVILKAHKKNASIFETEMIDTCLVVFYYYPGVTSIMKKHIHKKKLPHRKNDSPKSNEMSKIKTACYYHVTYEFWSESTLYSLPECQGTLSSKQSPYLKCS